MLDEGSPVPGTTDSLAPTFYSAPQSSAATSRIAGYNFNGSYSVPGGTGHPTPAQRRIRRVIIDLIEDATPAIYGSLHLSDMHALERSASQEVGRREGVEREALEQVLAILQATYANAGDNDEAGSLANTEHLLLDLELLYNRWAD